LLTRETVNIGTVHSIYIYGPSGGRRYERGGHQDRLFINSAGKQDPLTAYTNTFKAGFNKLDASVDETWQIDEDTPAAVGKFHITGKNDKGEAMDAEGVWSAAYVKQDGGWKIRMLTASVKPPPAK
jgi:ketosteroid isomerase-like protein